LECSDQPVTADIADSMGPKQAEGALSINRRPLARPPTRRNVPDVTPRTT
jgi:hypothetical protein